MKGDSEAPPTYNSIFSELKDQKDQSGGLADYTKNASGVVKSKVGGACGKVLNSLCLSACNFGLPIAELVIGGLHWLDCPAKYLLPRYLVVMGAVSVAVGSIRVWSVSTSNDGDCEENEGRKRVHKIINTISGFASGFLFCWFIAGNVFVFQMTKCDMDTFNVTTTTDCFTTDSAYRQSDLYCNKLLYDFTYWETVARWILVGLAIFFFCSCCCIICFAYCCAKSSSKE